MTIGTGAGEGEEATEAVAAGAVGDTEGLGGRAGGVEARDAAAEAGVEADVEAETGRDASAGKEATDTPFAAGLDEGCAGGLPFATVFGEALLIDGEGEGIFMLAGFAFAAASGDG